MMVTDIVRDLITYDDAEEWGITKVSSQKEIDKYNNSRKRFNFYPWGVWCTAYSRRNLWTGIVEFREHYCYADTDSIKCLHIEEHQDYINEYNRITEVKLQAMCKHHKIDYNELLPKTIKGVTKPLGVWDYEGHYDTFKTLGAKRYMVQEGDKLSITVSGINKKTAIPYLLDKYSIEECFAAFNEGMVIPAENTGKLTHYYIDKEYSGVVTDVNGVQYKYEALSGVYLEPAVYEFDISLEYMNFLKGMYYTK